MSVVTVDTAKRAGLPASVLRAKPPGVYAGTQTPFWISLFGVLAIADERVFNARLAVADLFGADRIYPVTGTHLTERPTGLPDMLLGLDFIYAHRIYVARDQGCIYFTYTGQPVFMTVEPDRPAPAGD